MKLERKGWELAFHARPRSLGQTGMKQAGRPESFRFSPSLEPLCPWVSPDQVQVVLSQMAGPKAILRAATHGLVLGALRGDVPLPEELEELRNQAQAGKCLAVQASSDQSRVERGRTLFGLGHLGASGSSPLSRS